MAVEIAKMTPTTLLEGYESVRISGGKEIEEWAEGFAIGYELPIAVARVFSSSPIGADMAPNAPVQFFAILKDAKPVSTSLLYLHGGLAGIYCVATVPAERGKGLGAHATAEPLRIAYDLGYRVGVLQSSVLGHPVYKRLGFADFGGVPLYIRVPTG
ncbi:MAG: GNAT family N-acetyltransferase [Planctomycetota bacterium]